MTDYKPANIDALAKAMYQRECDYTGRDHGGYCVSENIKTLKSFEAEIERMTTEDAALHAALSTYGWDSIASCLWHRALPNLQKAFDMLHVWATGDMKYLHESFHDEFRESVAMGREHPYGDPSPHFPHTAVSSSQGNSGD